MSIGEPRGSGETSGGQGGRPGGPRGSMATFDGPSDDLQGTTGFLKVPMGSRDLLRGPRWSRGAFRRSKVVEGVQGVQ